MKGVTPRKTCNNLSLFIRNIGIFVVEKFDAMVSRLVALLVLFLIAYGLFVHIKFDLLRFNMLFKLVVLNTFAMSTTQR